MVKELFKELFKKGEGNMRKFLSIFIAALMIFSLTAAVNPVAAADLGMHFTSPTAGATITTTSFAVQGTFDTVQTGNFKLHVVVGAQTHDYLFTVSGTTTWSVVVNMADFSAMVMGGTYTASLQAGQQVPSIPPVQTDPITITWHPTVTPPPTTCITITDTDKVAAHLYYYDPVPVFGGAGTVNDLTKQFVYKMGDVIHGYIDITPTAPWRIELRMTDGTLVDSVSMAAGSKYFTIGTGNVSYDGEYYVVAVVGGADHCSQKVFIEYNLIWGAKTLNNCAGTQTISGWITRGNDQTVLVPVVVNVAYPDNTLAGRYVITPFSSGQFTIQFPADGPDLDTAADIGKFRVYISDGYDPANDDNDEIVYDTLNNIPTVSITVSTYITPFIYKNQAGQPLLLVVKDENGNPVTGLLQTEWAVTNATVTGYAEISPGFYRFVLNVGSAVDVRFKATKSFYGSTVTSNQLVIDTRTLDIFNPYIDITAPNAMQYGEGSWELDSVQSVYDKLPCTVGNSFEIMVNSWPIPLAKQADWYIPTSDIGTYGAYYAPHYSGSAYWELNGPVVDVTPPYYGYAGYGFGDTMKVLVTQSGKISVTIYMTAWERVNKVDCPAWNTQGVTELAKSQNACCHTYTKTVVICDVASCTYNGVTLSGTNVVDSTTVEVGKKVDKVSISIDPTGAPTDLACSCPDYVVLMYMTDGDGNLLKDAFTVDTWSGKTVSGSQIWYNPGKVTGPNIPDQPIQSFKWTNTKGGIFDEDGNLVPGGDALKFGDCPFGLQGITFNYPTGTSCSYTLVVKVFGLGRKFDACGNMITTYPMIAEDFAPITVTPITTTLSATATLTEGTTDPDKILAGIPSIIDITDPGFTYDKETKQGVAHEWGSVSWRYYLNGKLLDAYSFYHTWVETGLTVTASKTDTGYRFILSQPFKSSGTFKIVGTSYYYSTDAEKSKKNCTMREVVTIEIEVVKPEFTVSIGLKDCDKSVIDSDGILTEGFDELVYVKAVDPRGVHDFSTDPNWQLTASAAYNACSLPTSKVCYVVEGPGCSYGLPIRVVGYDNPNLTDDPMVNIYFKSNGVSIKVTSLKLVPPTITVDPKEVPFTTAPDQPTNTHVTFTVTDAHGHHPSDISVTILNLNAFGVGGSGYSWSAIAGTTGCKGEVDWGFVPPFSGKYVVKAVPTLAITCALPCGWLGINTTATFEAVYKAPVVDTEAPKVEVTAPAEVATSTVKITGKATDNVGVVAVWIGAKQASLAPDGTFEAVLDLVAGDNTFTVSAYDAKGNVGTKSVTIKYVVPQVTKIVLKIGSDIMMVNDKAVQLDAAPEIKEGRTFLPLRAIAEAFGAQVTWVPDTKGITVVLGDTQIGLQIENETAVINGNVISIVAPYIKNGRTMVPFRVISEAFGADVQWDPINYIVTVTLQE